MSVDGRYKLETTEHVEIEFDLAGPGSRFCAWIIDVLLMGLLLLALMLLAVAVWGGTWYTTGGMDREFGGWALALLLAGVFLVTTFYHVFFESVMRGQTPGKRQLGLRVIRDDGVGMRFIEVLIRNLLRIADFLPALYLLGGVVSLFHPMHKRLGDLAAGTIVIKDAEPDYRAMSDRREREAPIEVRIGEQLVISPQEQQLVERFLTRRGELSLEARQSMADRLARQLYQRHGGHWDSAEQYLERLLGGRHDEP